MTHSSAQASFSGLLLVALVGMSGACGSSEESAGSPGSSGVGGGTGATATGGSAGELELPQPDLVFDPPRGLYTEPLDVSVTHPTLRELRYTLDASDPRTSPTALVGTLPLSIHVDPADPTGRYLAPGVVIRATVDGPSALPAQVITHTYLFPNRVRDLSPDGESPGGPWPEPGTIRQTGQVIDYGMDPEVTLASEYAGLVDQALLAIPSVSLVSTLDDLFSPERGIYANGTQSGLEWERFGSVEWLFSDARPAIWANTGIRIRGGFSANGFNPKHAFRLLFRSDYGPKRLKADLFDGEGVDSFDKLDLRTAQNYSWQIDGAELSENVMNRDVFSRDLQRELGQPYTRSRYYHLYLDGVYWGLYQTQERSESAFAESYLGGLEEDWDTIKVDRSLDEADPVIEATTGTLDAWRTIFALCQAGFADDEAYHRLEGKNANGQRDPTLDVLVDIDNLIDFMQVIFYTANFDGPCSKWFQNQQPNNFYALRNRVTNDRGFVFLAHDNEHTLLAEPITITTGVDENRVDIGHQSGAFDGDGWTNRDYVMNVEDASDFHPQWLHHRLMDNASYRARFAARARQVLAPGGVLTPDVTIPLFEGRAAEIRLAIIAESARWGDAAGPERPRTRDTDWTPAIERTKTGFLASRTGIVIEQLSAVGLY